MTESAVTITWMWFLISGGGRTNNLGSEEFICLILLMYMQKTFGVFLLAILALNLVGCGRQSEPTDAPEMVRIGQDRAFIKPPPYNSPTRPHWLTGKDQIPRFPEEDFYAIPIDQLFFSLKVSEILNRPDLKDENQFSRDSVYVKVAGLGKERTDDVGKDELERYRLSGKTAHSRYGWTCYYMNPDKDEDCFVSLGEESLKINLTRPGKFPYQKYDVYFFSNVHGRVYVYWNTSERNLPYWSEIQQAIMQKLVAWRFTKS